LPSPEGELTSDPVAAPETPLSVATALIAAFIDVVEEVEL
jgi:hypothetical protein